VYFLQDPRNPAAEHTGLVDYGVSYLHLLDFLGNLLDPKTETISLRGELAKNLAKGAERGAKARRPVDPLHIRDPNDPNNNLGRGATRFPHIQEVCRFELARQMQSIGMRQRKAQPVSAQVDATCTSLMCRAYTSTAE
jgi:hypothetical protein